MTTSRDQWSLPDGTRDAAVARLEQEIAQLRQAVGSHAVVDQAIGVLIAIHRIPPHTGFEVLREVSQHRSPCRTARFRESARLARRSQQPWAAERFAAGAGLSWRLGSVCTNRSRPRCPIPRPGG
ncbi:ANTAR domain-containing protein [Streptomyces sp. NPDC058295]|uniref:ANTAR domain-containing protein n=1 Tax=Streptomyces sp. NPDC058295 TaxID=3346431 RepID=UPI0036E7325B